MKKTLSILLVLCMVLAVMPLAASAESAEVASGTWGGNLTWVLDEEGTLTISGEGAMADYNYTAPIPWHEYREQILRLVICDGITTIGSFAFNNCTNLTNVEIPDSVTTIGMAAFSYCISLTGLDIPDGVTTIGREAFSGCSGLTSIIFDDSVTTIGIAAFSDCTGLTNITIGDSVTTIGQDAFLGCTGLTAVNIPDSVTTLDSAFGGCTSLRSIRLPAGITEIVGHTFSGCTSLAEVTIPDSVRDIGMYAFSDCTSLTSITIPAGVIDIGNYTFYDCTSLKEVFFQGDWPINTTTFNCYIFRNVTATAYYPAGNETWTAEVMQNYGGTITWVPYSNGPEVVASGTCGDNVNWTLDENGLLTISGEGKVAESADANYPWTEYADRILKVIFEEGVTNVPAGAFFYRYSNLASVELKSVEVIEPEAFGRCEALTSVTLPDTLKEIGKRAFMQCTALDSLELNEGLEIIGQEAFSVCHSLSGSMTIPGTVTQVSSGPFDFTAITDVYFLGDMPQIDEYTFSAVDITVYYPGNNDTWTEEKIEACKGIATWVPYGEVSEPTAKFTTISTSLGGNIAMNFYLELSEDLVAAPEAYIQFTYAGKTVKVPLSEGVLSGGVYRFSCPITSKNMTDEITAQVYNGSGAVGESKTMDVATYCNWVIDNYTDAKTVNLMKAMLNYGASAQMLFNYRTDDLANAALAESDKVFGKVDASTFLHSRTGEEEGIKPDNYTLLLDSETTVRVYFKLTGNKTIDEYTFTVDGVEVTPKFKDGLYYIEKANISAHRLDDLSVFTCGGITITYGGLSYVNQVMTYYTEGTTFDMASALYAYSVAAEAYIG